jgi:uncharacterized protein DUF6318
MRRGFVAGLLATTFLLPACTHDDPPPPPPTTTQAPTTPTPSPTLTPPPAPTAARTPAGAEAFVRYFWATYNYAYATLDPKPLQAISDKACELCASAAKKVNQLKQADKRIQGWDVVVVAAVSPPIQKRRGVIVATNLRQNAGTSISAAGEVEALKAVPNHRGYVGLRWIDGRWSVDGISIEDLKARP